MLEGFSFSSPSIAEYLTGKMALLKKYNGLSVPVEYFDAAMARLRDDRLNVSLDAVLHPISEEVQETVRTQQSAANQAMQVNKKDLTSQEWFEKGNGSTDVEEKLHFYSEAIRLHPGFVEAYHNRGVMHKNQLEFDFAIRDFTNALRLRPDYGRALRGLGNAYAAKGEDIAAYFCLKRVAELEPENSRAAFIRILMTLGRLNEAEEQAVIARKSIQKEIEYNQACFEAICGNTDRALELLKVGLEKNQATRAWARRDPDLETLRDHPRFKELFDE